MLAGFTLTGSDGFSFRTNSPSFPVGFLDKMKHPALQVVNGQVDFANFQVKTPIAGFDVTRSALGKTRGFRLKVIPPYDSTVRLESSRDLSDWTRIAEFGQLSEPLEFIDPSATNYQGLFYRLVVP